ncbi:hypothetical protein CABS01_09561 [Colletotrichum abscissum]|uniref:Secreted protein n=1 Tax=Colletotrichum costaricense TaxID=1209916 RepID=A0AAI9YKB4_9PEZI|nr:uncharacterized protein CCOS01_14076 [Colletotrichum costaricense]XP_060400134.1 uncharacterized protein CABS01_09561 [Colletotrichum abscissum]KAK1501830.1 hypothetical protein CABS01_09561 [Colletotrichum abscissum]KAK1514136.1 hypothetical protein CCOS01_14076 [Colletotrichum costaricense]KAK1719781.1 hypothetical protein BDP67DRAFT_132303 [Colletotrichum lupini]
MRRSQVVHRRVRMVSLMWLACLCRFSAGYLERWNPVGDGPLILLLSPSPPALEAKRPRMSVRVHRQGRAEQGTVRSRTPPVGGVAFGMDVPTRGIPGSL